MPFRRIALASLLVLVLCGCLGGAIKTAPATSSATATLSARATPKVTVTPTASATPTGSAAPDSSRPATGEEPDRHAFPELEARLPEEIAGVQTDRYSFSGSALDGGMIDDLFIVWARKADRSPDEMRVALAVPPLEADLGVFVGVMQLPGLSGEELAAGGLADIGEERYEVREIAGRRVAIGPTFAVFWEGDRLFIAADISSLGGGGTGELQTPSLLEQAISAIP
jgi:hypothetical protein